MAAFSAACEIMNIQLQDASHGPAYLQIRQQIETQIRDGVLRAGSNLPAPTTLGQKLSIDRGEVQRAYFELEQYGLVRKKTGKDFLGKEKVNYSVA
jgi:GntR family transcriptional regulator